MKKNSNEEKSYLEQYADAKDKAELAVHMKEKINDRMEVPEELQPMVYEDMESQIKREFGIAWDNPLTKWYLAEAHELIDTYRLPIFLHEALERIQNGEPL